MLFADDVFVDAETRQEAEERLEWLREAMEDRGTRVSREKTEFLRIAANGEEQREGAARLMQGEMVRGVEEFKYLRLTVQADGGSKKEVAKRIQAGWGAWKKITGLMCDRKVPEMARERMYKTMVRPTMMYGMDAMAITRKQEKMQVAETKMLRWSLGLTLKDNIRNEREIDHSFLQEPRCLKTFYISCADELVYLRPLHQQDLRTGGMRHNPVVLGRFYVPFE
ncbi:uncharacterized protein LOC122253897 [Penaeus japonicus]|uniref:uncharacterized protein LOC122253897 n=1 Tax=Penaeus japonicus TaxID=27405 RepID=UPI001C7108E3|nr:uncharacterized protein LOC122253897 [Penaeus japonicus]